MKSTTQLAVMPKPPKVPAEAKQKYNKSMQTVAAFAKFGVHVLRIKSETLAALGKSAEAAGIHSLGHGKVIVVSDHAETAMQHLDGRIENLVTAAEPDDKLILEMLRLKKEFNDQLLRTAQAHFNADKPSESNGKTMTLPPPGTTVMIAVGKDKNGG